MAHINPDDAKRRLRQEARQAREGADPQGRAAADKALARAVAAGAAFNAASMVLAYYSAGSEVDTHGLIAEALRCGKTVALPRCRRGERAMDWHIIASLDDAAPGYCGIPEPADDPLTRIDPSVFTADTLALVPGLLFDARGFRLGYGGGYYDRFLAQFPGVALGLARKGQLVESLAALGALDAFDRPVNLLATEQGVRATG
ncbi:5-formyltetrahydrofolate cyclo-ligase [uncultured Adlercreutzia sp.]|uniref:5-formyltetrahydrofolate cyclo-ligase n=1 Tax=uncultured Adlercreutzia sp. TaxID=875803 RepID=UPI002600DDD5|nr:5-formyltetrahydrofolate cyclo-ligase [uncultured Adlercreutzia sp.]